MARPCCPPRTQPVTDFYFRPSLSGILYIDAICRITYGNDDDFFYYFEQQFCTLD